MSYSEPPIEQKIDGYMYYGQNQPFCVDALLEKMDQEHIERAVVFETYGSPKWREIEKAVQQHPQKLSLHIYICPGADDMRSAAWKELIDVAGKENKTIAIDLEEMGFCENTVLELDAIASAYPNQVFILSHLGYANCEVRKNIKVRKIWDDMVGLCKAHKNIRFAVSGFAKTFSDEDYPYESGQRLIEEALGYIGANKFIWGSATPGMDRFCTYRETISVIEEDYHIPRTQKSTMMYLNARYTFFK